MRKNYQFAGTILVYFQNYSHFLLYSIIVLDYGAKISEKVRKAGIIWD